MHPLHHPLFIQYIIHFNSNEDYFECHEVGEEYWKDVAPKDKTHPLAGWIQMSVGMYHWRRSNFPGALRSFIRAKDKLSDAGIWTEGFDGKILANQLSGSIEAVTARTAFTPYRLPVVSEELAQAVRHHMAKNPSETLDAHFLMHKHRLRDRTSIINLREQKKRRNL
ncbi:DUF309 domain-containing protein [Planococcus salinarum]|uniref:DUF309 domain-containing protein n=1 Tax=Planococcus salinarum TaxID=622695 RepID=UPI000E3E3085|nr:DUF309 domain-containing protein [Planococcus salinarum]TAA72512.1 DUF309 domain-containing protein [Planococcus salinarum]